MSTRYNTSEIAKFVERAVDGDELAWNELLSSYRPRLRKMLSLRLYGRLMERVDPSDIIQDACLDATRRLSEYAKRQEIPFYLWLRGLTLQRLVDCFRLHLGTQSRDPQKELPFPPNLADLEHTSVAAIVAQLVDDLSTPSRIAIREEECHQLHEALDQLEPIDREILTLRHFEQLSNQETADLLGLDKSAASKRYARALRRLRKTLEDLGLAPS